MQNGIQSGEIVGDRYCILYELGRSQWGRTYVVRERDGRRDRGLLEVFAPALPRDSSVARATALFEEAARGLARLQHPQIPQLKAFFSAPLRSQTRWCCVFDCIEGLNYQELLQMRSQHGKRFKEEEVLVFLTQILPVLSYLHRSGATHGALAPENILLRQADTVPVLIHFAAFKQVVAVLEASGEREGFYAGMPGYAPREQEQAGIVLPQSDLYTLGATALALLSAREPQALVASGDWSQVPASPAFIEVLQSMLAPEPSDRYPDANLALKAVRELLLEQPDAAPAEEPAAMAIPAPAPPPLAEFLSLKRPTAAPLKDQEAIVPSGRSSLEPLPGKSLPDFEETSPPARWGKALAKIALVCGFSLLSGTAGWQAGRWWIDRSAQSQASQGESFSIEPEALSFLPDDDPEPEPSASLPEAERERKLALRERRLQAGIPYQFFTELTNELFWLAYPSQRGRTPSLAVEDGVWRDRWDSLAEETLERLTFLSLPARQRLGSYEPQERERAARAAALLNVSENAFFDAIDAQFAYRFSELANVESQETASEQLWQAMAADRLRALRGDKALVPLSLARIAPSSMTGILQPGEVKLFLLEVERGETINAFLNADLAVGFGLYTPAGDRAIDPPKLRSWSGTASETGIYAVTLVSQSPVASDYILTLNNR